MNARNEASHVPGSVGISLSIAQQEIWREYSVYPRSSVHTVGAFTHLSGSLDLEIFETSLKLLWERHVALRLTPVLQSGSLEPVLIEAKQPDRMMVFHDLSSQSDPSAGAHELLGKLGRQVIPLEGDVTFRFDLIRLAPDKHIWAMCYHHINMDAWSNGIVVRDVADAYTKLIHGQPWDLSPAPSYAETNAGDASFLESKRFLRNQEYWVETHQSLPDRFVDTNINLFSSGAASGTFLRRINLKRPVVDRLRIVAIEQNTTFARLFIAATLILLHARSHASDVVFGMPVLNRPTARDKETLGLFSLVTAPRVEFQLNDDLGSFLSKLDRSIKNALRHYRFPLSEIGRHLKLASRGVLQLFDVSVSFERVDYRELSFGDVSASVPEVLLNGSARVPIEVFVREYGDSERVQVDLDLSDAVFGAETADKFADQFERVLDWLSSGGCGLVSSVPLVDDSERAWLLRDVNATARDYGVFEPVHQTIERVVEATPDIAAVRFGGIELSYGELWERSGILAHRLRRLGVGPEIRVGVALERSIELVVTLLAVLRAGGAYVPLDPELPVDRLSFMISDAAAPVVVTRSELLDLLPVHDGRTLLVDGPMRASSRTADELPVVCADTLAYVIYTSGSTGQPKGVMNHHEGLRNRLLWMGEAFPIGAGDRVLQKTPYTFDVSVWEFFWPLMEGACLVVARPGGHRDPDYLAQVLQDEAITVTHFVPSMLQAFLGHGPAASSLSTCNSLRHVICSGEALPPALVEAFYKHASSTCSLDNLYGPTEAAIDVTRWSCQDPGQQLVPIGHAVANTAMYVLDSSMEPVPVGVVGELWIGGVQVSRGYLGRPVLTACSFIADPHGGIPGARMYRTGDLGRRRPDGSLEYLGRIDQQVKLRGFRIELGEIESALLTHDAVSAAAVLLREDRVGDPRLVAYVVVSGGRVPVDLTEQLRKRLPEHMVPSSVVALSELPITANGKLDRQALPAPNSNTSGEASTASSVVRGPEEEIICAVFAGVLGRETVGPEENFFALGGHSLLAVQAISQLRNALDIELPANAVLAAPSAREVARLVRTETAARQTLRPSRIFGAPRMASAAESRLRFLQELNPADTSYNMTGAIDLDGSTDLPALTRALAAVQLRHPSLYSIFELRDDLVWSVPVASRVFLPVVEGPFTVSEADAQEAIEAARPFDLKSEHPFRVRLLRLNTGNVRIILAFHHVGADAQSVSIFAQELDEIYLRAITEPDLYPEGLAQTLKAPTGDALLAEELAIPTHAEKTIERWKARLSGVSSEIALPKEGNVSDSSLVIKTLHLDSTLRRKLAKRAVEERVTFFMLLHTALAVLLHRLTGEDDVVIGTPISLRSDSSVERTVGMLLNTVPLRLTIDRGSSIQELISQVRTVLTEAISGAGTPLEEITAAIDPTRLRQTNPLFQVLLTTHSPHLDELSLAGSVASIRVVPQASAKMDLVVLCADNGDSVDVTFEIASSVSSPRMAQRLVGSFKNILDALSLSSEQLVSSISLLSEEEFLSEVSGLEVCDNRSVPEGSIIDHFCSVADAEAFRVALEDQRGRKVTYSELNDLSARVAIGLLKLGVERGSRVGIGMTRGIDQIVMMLAVLRAGAAYVPLDLEQPEDRRAGMAADAGVEIIVGDVGGSHSVTLQTLIDTGAETEGNIETASSLQRSGADTAYVMFTSGSTGRPKGIAIPDRAILRLALEPGFAEFYPGKRIAQIATTAFDAATYEIWCALLNGGTVVVIDRDATYDPANLAAAFNEMRPDSMFLTTAVFNRVVRADCDAFPKNSEIMFGGEAVDSDAVRHARKRWPTVRFVHVYGPTETTTFASFHEVQEKASHERSVPIGKPIRATSLYVLDDFLSPVPRGVAGQLYIGGEGLADGYVGAPNQTAESFLADPFSSTPGARMYRTGDRVRRLEDGSVEFLGRVDRQIKLRGYRIEPGEIEAAIRTVFPKAVDVVVDARSRSSNGADRTLYAWLDGGAIGPELERELRSKLAQLLPAWMVPRRIIGLENLPINANGKVDARALFVPDNDESKANSKDFSTQTEKLLAELWSELLDGAPVEPGDEFFGLGGHSLLGVRLVALINEKFNISLALRNVFERPSLEAMAADIDNLKMISPGNDEGSNRKIVRLSRRRRSEIRGTTN